MNPDLAGLELLDDLDQVFEATAETAQPPDDEVSPGCRKDKALRSLLK